MRLTRNRPVGAALIIATCVLLPDVGRPDDAPPAPPPRAVKGKEPAPSQPGKPAAEPPSEWSAKFAGRTPDEILAVLNQLAQDGIVRRGGYEVARLRLTEAVGEALQVRAKAGTLSPPAAMIPLAVHRPADVEAGIKAAQQFADYHAARVQLLDGMVSTRAALDTRAREFDRAATAARDHLATMSAAARAAALVLKDRLPPVLDPKRLEEEAAQLQIASAAASDEAKKAQALLGAVEKELAAAKAASVAAGAKLNELKAARETALEALAFEEKVREMTTPILIEEFNRLRKLFAEKTAAIKGDTHDYAKAGPAAAEARSKLDAIRDPAVPPDPVQGTTAPTLEAIGHKLVTAQQYLAARVRTIDERAEKAAVLVSALGELEKKALAYSTTLEDARRIGGHLAVTAAELERRVGRGDLKAADAPDVAEAAGTAGGRAKLDADAAAVQKTLADLRTERDTLRKTDTEAENRKALTVVLLGRVNERIDLLTDLKRLAAEYATARKDRPEGEQKRMDQRAAERMAHDAEPWSRFFALDHSKAATDLSDLLSAYYKELVDLDEKGENLEHQKGQLNKLIELTRKQTEDVAKLRTLLEKHRTRPETAPWDGWLAGQLAPGGLKAEADVYHDEGARLAANDGANARRVAALTGNPPEKSKSAAEQPQHAASGGEIGQARSELLEARVRGLIVTGIKIGATLLAALLVPPILMFILRRAIRGGTDAAGNLSPVLAALRGVLKIGTWIAAVALVLSVLGYDVTALVGGLAIGVLAIALAARPMIADVLGSVVIFAERRFQVGDVVRLGGGEPARVVGLTWRSTALKNPAGLVASVPNRKVTEATVENLSRGTETYDTLAVTISTDKDAGRVVGVIRAALAQCKNLSPTEQGVTVLKFNQKGPVKVVEYRFWWFLKDYEVRNKTRDEVFARIAVGLAHEDMTGIEVTLA